MRLAAPFLSQLGKEAEGVDVEALEAQLLAVLTRVRSAHPNCRVSETDFLSHVALRLREVPDSLSALQTLRWEDLYLTFACTKQDPHALAFFESEYGRGVTSALSSILKHAAQVDEAKQAVWVKLLVGSAEQSARIGSYGGRGDLASWLRAVSTRLAFDNLDSSQREVPSGDVPLEAFVFTGIDLESEHLKEKYLPEFKQSFRDAFRSLTPRDRNLLRQHYVHGQTLGQVATLYGMGRATATRKIAKARDLLLRRTLANLRTKLGLSADELDSVLRLLQTRLDISSGDLHEES
jgi:RNA polymerase sigma-70 factor, ECF subfamily